MKLTVISFTLLISAICTSLITYADDDFGRLFTSEAERRQLDAVRKNQNNRNLVEELPATDTNQPEASNIPPMNIKFSGYMRRSDGAYAYWVNGQSNLSGAKLPIQSAHFSKKNDSVSLSTTQYKAVIKPGQVWSLKDNAIYEGYNLVPGP